MIGACITVKGASPFAIPAKPASGVLNGRTVTSLPPAQPRVNCSSSFKCAFNLDGFRGLFQWVIRAIENNGTSVEEREKRPEKIKTAFADALQHPIDSEVWRKNFKKILEDAAWYEVAFSSEGDSAIGGLRACQLKELITACGSSKSLSSFATKINDMLTLIKGYENEEKSRVEAERKALNLCSTFFKFAMLLKNQDKQDGIVTKELVQLDELLKRCDDAQREENVKTIFSKCSPAILLLISKVNLESIPQDLPFVKDFCEKANKKLKQLTTIDCSQLGDEELDQLHLLAKHEVMSFYLSACATEIEKRSRKKGADELAANFEIRISALARKQNPTMNSRKPLSIAPFSTKLTSPEISSVASQVIAKTDPAIVIKLSALEFESLDSFSRHLVNAAKDFLKRPDVKSLDQKKLLAYLALPESAISANGRQLLLEEVKERAIRCIKSRFKHLANELECDPSFDSLVSAMRFFSDSSISDSKLEDVFKKENNTEFETALQNARKQFSEKVELLNKSGKFHLMRARQLIVQLYEQSELPGSNGNALKVVADHFSEEIRRANYRSKEGLGKLVPPSPHEIECIRAAISNCFPIVPMREKDGTAQSKPEPEAFAKFLDYFHADCIRDNQFSKVRTPGAVEMPVGQLFVHDQRDPKQTIYGEPIIKSSLQNNVERASEFVRKMRDMGCTDEQIMMASRIAGQSVANAMTDLVRNERLIPFLDHEVAQVEGNGIGRWLVPASLSNRQNFERDERGVLIAQVRLFNESVVSWPAALDLSIGDSVVASTVPEKSSFSVELVFEINGSGEIEKCTVQDWIAKREIKEIGQWQR